MIFSGCHNQNDGIDLFFLRLILSSWNVYVRLLALCLH